MRTHTNYDKRRKTWQGNMSLRADIDGRERRAITVTGQEPLDRRRYPGTPYVAIMEEGPRGGYYHGPSFHGAKELDEFIDLLTEAREVAFGKRG